MVPTNADKQQQQLNKLQPKQCLESRVHRVQRYFDKRLKNLREKFRQIIGWLRKPETIRFVFGLLWKCYRIIDTVERVLDWINKIHQ
jgi:kynureninase